MVRMCACLCMYVCVFDMCVIVLFCVRACMLYDAFVFVFCILP